MKKLMFIALLGTLGYMPSAYARPVSYPGGWTLILNNDTTKNTALVHYSPTAKTSIGYKFENWREKDFTLHAIQMNNLLKRWNNKNSQANLYLKTGLGIANEAHRDDTSEAAGFSELAADWETRRLFASYQARYTAAGGVDDFYTQAARVGWAPYEGDYGDLHTWLMLQVDHSPESRHEWTVTPLVRLFKGTHLLEVGVNTRGSALLNYTFRY